MHFIIFAIKFFEKVRPNDLSVIFPASTIPCRFPRHEAAEDAVDVEGWCASGYAG
jgi:hypothetical protein